MNGDMRESAWRQGRDAADLVAMALRALSQDDYGTASFRFAEAAICLTRATNDLASLAGAQAQAVDEGG